jgi:hypothetical protein
MVVQYLCGKKYLLMDRDTNFSEAFRATLEEAAAEAVRIKDNQLLNPKQYWYGPWLDLR